MLTFFFLLPFPFSFFSFKEKIDLNTVILKESSTLSVTEGSFSVIRLVGHENIDCFDFMAVDIHALSNVEIGNMIIMIILVIYSYLLYYYIINILTFQRMKKRSHFSSFFFVFFVLTSLFYSLAFLLFQKKKKIIHLYSPNQQQSLIL